MVLAHAVFPVVSRRILTLALAAALVLAAAVGVPPVPAGAATDDGDRTFVVDVDRDSAGEGESALSTDRIDANPGDGVCEDSEGGCTLRAAIMEANALGGHTVIRFDPALENSDGQIEVVLSAWTGMSENASVQGDLDIAPDVTVQILGSATAVQGPPIDSHPPRLRVFAGVADDVFGSPEVIHRAFHVLPGATLRLHDVLIFGFRAIDDGTTTRARALGGAVLVEDGILEASRLAVIQSGAEGGSVGTPPFDVPGTSTGEARGGAIAVLGGSARIVDSLMFSTFANGGDAADVAATSGGDGLGGLISGEGADIHLERLYVQLVAARGGEGEDGGTSTAANGGNGWGGFLYVDDASSATVRDVDVAGGVAIGGAGATPASGAGGDGGVAAGGGVLAVDSDLLIDRATFGTADLGLASPTSAIGGDAGGGADGGGAPGGAGGAGGDVFGGAIAWSASGGDVRLQHVTVDGAEADGGSGGSGGLGTPDGASGPDGDGLGAGFYGIGSATLRASTIVDTAATGGTTSGALSTVGIGISTAGLLVANNTPKDCDGAVDSLGGNLDGDGTCDFDHADDTSSAGTIGLGPLEDLGGWIRVRAPSSVSDAVDANPGCAGLSGTLAMDARGAPRPAGAACDAGAVERHTQPVLEVALDAGSVTEGDDLVATVTAVGGTLSSHDATLSAGGDLTGSDLSGLGPVTVSGSRTLDVALSAPLDGIDEGTEEGSIVLGSPTNATLSLLRGSAPLAVTDRPQVSVTADVTELSEGGSDTVRRSAAADGATVTFSRTGSTHDDLPVPVDVGGNAVPGEDVTGIPAQVVIPAGATSASFEVTVLDNDAADPLRVLTLAAGSGPIHESAGSVSLTILDDEASAIGRIAGDNRVETAVEVSRAAFPGGADVVLLARADAYPDALAGAPLAADLGGPILLTPSDRLHEAVAEELDRLDAAQVILLGGEGALGSAVATAVADTGRDLDRIEGANRYETAGAIATRLLGDSPSDSAAYLTEGGNADPRRGWPDALSVSGLAAAQGRPILLTLADRLPTATMESLADLDVADLTIVGGAAAVSEQVQRAVEQQVADVDRVSGPSRYATSAAVADLALANGASAATTYLATGLDFPDALVAGPAVAGDGAVLLLVHGREAERSPETLDWLAGHAAEIAAVRVLGGAGAVANEVLIAVAERLAPT